MHEQPSADKQPVHPEVQHEKSDANVGRIVLVGVTMAAAAILIHVVVAWQFDVYRAREERKQPRLSPLAAKRARFPDNIDKIPAPRLEVDDRTELKSLREAEEARLKNYGWSDPKAGTVHIPIDEAMRMLADPKAAEARGIRVRPPKGNGKGGQQ